MKRPLCAFGFAFMTAALAVSFLPLGVMNWIIATGAILAVLSFVFLKGNTRKMLVICALAVVTAVSMFYVKTGLQYNKVITLADTSITLTGKVYDIKERDDGKYTYYIHADEIKDLDVPKFDVIIYSDADLKADYYDKMKVYTQLFLPSDNYGFDSVRYYSGDNIFVLGYTDGVGAYITKTNRTSVMYLIKDINRYLGNIIDDMFDGNISSVIKAMILGDTGGLDFNLKQDYVYSGTYHMFAISGFHVMIICEFVIFLLSLFRISKRKIYAIALLVIYVFVIFSGIHIATLRAAIMLSITLIGKMLYQKSDSLNSLAISGLLICCLNIYNIMSMSFMLTFASSLGIILFSKRISTFLIEKLNAKGTLSRLVIETQAVTLGTSICVLPVYVFSFGYVSAVSFAANLITYVTATPIVILSFVLVILILTVRATFIIGPVCRLLELFIKAQNNAMSMCADFKFATIGLNYDHVKLWLVASVIIFALCAALGKGYKYIKQALIISVIMLIGMSCFYQYSVRDSVRMYILGDGTVSSVIFVNDGHTAVISTDDDSYIDTQTLSFLRSKGINKIDTLIYTYTKLNYPEDTLRLVDNISVDCILYNKNNQDIYNELNRTNVVYTLNEIQNCTVDIGDDLSVELYYINTKLSADIICFDKTLTLSNNMKYLSQVTSDLVLISESSVDERINNISAFDIVMLRSQYGEADYSDKCIYGYENALYCAIKANEKLKIKYIS